MRRQPLVLLLPALLAAACASTPQWHKPGATSEATAADLELCRRSVPLEPRTAPPPRVPTKPGQLIDFNSMSEHEGERFLRDERHVGECMRDKGYIDAAS